MQRAWFVGSLLLSSLPAVARADEPGPLANAPGESRDALPGVMRLPLATPARAPIALTAALSYGFYPVAALQPRTQRVGGQLSAAWSPWQFLAFRAGLTAVMGSTPRTSGGRDTSYYGEPQLAARTVTEVGRGVHVGAELAARMVGADAPSVRWNALTPTLAALLAYRARSATWLGAELGYRLDRSAHAVSDARRLLPEDRLILHASSWDAVVLGVGASHRTGPFELLAEATAEWLVGASAPRASASPWGGALGVRYHAAPSYSLQVAGELNGSRLAALPSSQLQPVRPQFAAELGLTWRLGIPTPAPRPHAPLAAPPRRAAPAPPPPPTPVVSGVVVDEGGHPVAGLLVTLEGPGSEATSVKTDAQGAFRFERAPLGAARLSTAGGDYESTTQALEVSGEGARAGELVVYPALPPGQVKGRALDLRGNPVAATILVEPGAQSLHAGDDGAFAIDLKPGTYTLRFSHPDFATSVRTVRVEQRGVVVLDVAIEK